MLIEFNIYNDTRLKKSYQNGKFSQANECFAKAGDKLNARVD